MVEVANDRVHDERLAVGDAFGEALLACYRGGSGPGLAYELVERSDGYLAASDAAKYFAAVDVRALVAVTGRVLDIGAGASWARPSIPTALLTPSTWPTTRRTGASGDWVANSASACATSA